MITKPKYAQFETDLFSSSMIQSDFKDLHQYRKR